MALRDHRKRAQMVRGCASVRENGPRNLPWETSFTIKSVITCRWASADGQLHDVERHVNDMLYMLLMAMDLFFISRALLFRFTVLIQFTHAFFIPLAFINHALFLRGKCPSRVCLTVSLLI